MDSFPNVNDDRQLAQPRAASIQTYARIGGVLFLLSMAAGGFGEAYVPSNLIVSADAPAISGGTDGLFVRKM